MNQIEPFIFVQRSQMSKIAFIWTDQKSITENMAVFLPFNRVHLNRKNIYIEVHHSTPSPNPFLRDAAFQRQRRHASLHLEKSTPTTTWAIL